MSQDASRHVLLVYSRVGGGHLSAARALAAELESTGCARATLVDAYLDCGRFPVTLFPSAYARLARRHPRMWSMVYHASDRRVNPRRVLGPFLKTGFRRLMARERPDLVVSVLPAINGLVADAAASVDARLEVVLTDWNAVHPLWVARGVDHYTAPTDAARSDLLRVGAARTRVDVVGIPISRAFAVPSEPPPREPERFTILAMVGAEGSPRALRNIARLARLDLDARLLVVCGRNAELRRRVQRLPAGMHVEALGFVDNVAELMRSAQVVVTKAGGLTLAEAFACGVPVVVHDVLPGQEAGNLTYVMRQDAVAYAPHPAALVEIVSELYADPARRQKLAERSARLARPDAAARIAHNLLARLAKKDAESA